MDENTSASSETQSVVSIEDVRELLSEELKEEREEDRQLYVDTVLNESQVIANDAANIAVENSNNEIGEMVRSLADPVVRIEEEQWDYMQGAIKGMTAQSLVGLLLSSLILGVLVAQILVERWRR